MKPILLTGATGFVGGAVLRHLVHAGCPVRVAARRTPALSSPLIECVEIGDLARLSASEAAALVKGTHGVIHAAGYTEKGDSSLHAAINRDATIRLAEAGAFFGDGVFIFLSSIRAQSGATSPYPVQEADFPAPTDLFGNAKREAEEAIRLLLPERHIILRPVLVCGRDAKGTLAQVQKLARIPVPLPLGDIKARRSLLSVEDLAALIVRALLVKQVLGKTLIVADPEPMTLAQIIGEMRLGLGKSPQIFSIPKAAVIPSLRLFFGEETSQELTGSLIAIPKLLTQLGWEPIQGIRAALRGMMR